jgi:hypothetical protein
MHGRKVAFVALYKKWWGMHDYACFEQPIGLAALLWRCVEQEVAEKGMYAPAI